VDELDYWSASFSALAGGLGGGIGSRVSQIKRGSRFIQDTGAFGGLDGWQRVAVPLFSQTTKKSVSAAVGGLVGGGLDALCNKPVVDRVVKPIVIRADIIIDGDNVYVKGGL